MLRGRFPLLNFTRNRDFSLSSSRGARQLTTAKYQQAVIPAVATSDQNINAKKDRQAAERKDTAKGIVFRALYKFVSQNWPYRYKSVQPKTQDP